MDKGSNNPPHSAAGVSQEKALLRTHADLIDARGSFRQSLCLYFAEYFTKRIIIIQCRCSVVLIPCCARYYISPCSAICITPNKAAAYPEYIPDRYFINRGKAAVPKKACDDLIEVFDAYGINYVNCAGYVKEMKREAPCSAGEGLTGMSLANIKQPIFLSEDWNCLHR